MSIELAVLISICLLGAAPVLFIRARHAPVLQTAASLLALVLGLDIARSALLPPPGTRAPAPGLLYGFLRVDPLAAIMIVLVTSVCFLTALVALSRSRARFETSGERTKTQRLRRLAESKEPRRIAILSLLFEASLIVVVSCDNLGFLWIGLETAALLGALLVGSRGGANAVGAALKYVLLGGEGLVIALLGTAPLTAFHFNQISVAGVLANLLVVPFLGTGAVLLGLLSAAALFVHA
ncbi:ComEC/Rec2 family competence protein, partial [bacterium]|nr:ComEC/Rec2 family competence protein [bacterium]